MNNYAAYLKERENKYILENRHGFIVYKINDKDCFIAEMFIQKEQRGSGLLEQMIGELTELAKLNKCETITATIFLNDRGANRTLRASQKFNFNIIQANNDVLLIQKGVNYG